MAERKTLTVAADGSAMYRTLTEAVQVCAADPQAPVRFYLKRGVYAERPFIELEDYVLEGEDRDETILTAGVGGRDPWPGEEKTGTFRSWTLFLGGGKAVVKNLTVQNTAGDGARVGQALAVYADAGRVLMQGVNLYGNQDTLFTAPLPLREREKNGFRGPRQDSPRLNTEQYYQDCRIRGNIDFIFGGANAVFDHCKIEPLHHKTQTCYITAPSTPPERPGYLFVDCTVHGDCPPHTAYLGRPWRADAACYWMDCSLSEEVHPDGWDNWHNPTNEQTARFGESHSRGLGAAVTRAFGSVNDAGMRQRYEAYLQEMRKIFEL